MKNIVLTIFMSLLCASTYAEVAIPPWTQPVIDLTGTLTLQQTQFLAQRISAFEARKGAQIGVLIVPTTQTENVFEFGMRVFDTWKLGRKGVDDGLLWVISADNGRWHIFTGYGLEGVLPDAKVKQLAEEFIDPYFNRGEVFTGIEKGMMAFMRTLDTEPLPPPSSEHAPVECASVTPPQKAIAIPAWTAAVIDLSGTMDVGQLVALNKRLRDFEFRKGAQIGVLIVHTTQPETLPQFAMRVCARWKLGREGIGDSVVMAVDQETKQVHIIVGYGLDKVLNNAKLGTILSETIIPNLMVGEFDTGIIEGIDAMMKVVDTIPLPPPDQSLIDAISKKLSHYFWTYFGFFTLIALLGITLLLRNAKRPTNKSGLID